MSFLLDTVVMGLFSIFSDDLSDVEAFSYLYPCLFEMQARLVSLYFDTQNYQEALALGKHNIPSSIQRLTSFC